MCLKHQENRNTTESGYYSCSNQGNFRLVERAWRHTLGAAILYSPLERKVVRNRQKVGTRTRTRLEGLWEEQQKGRKGTIERTVEAPLGRPRYTNIRGHHRKGLLGDIWRAVETPLKGCGGIMAWAVGDQWKGHGRTPLEWPRGNNGRAIWKAVEVPLVMLWGHHWMDCEGIIRKAVVALEDPKEPP